MNEQDNCLGCFRSLNEILQWAAADDVLRKIMLENCERRRQDYADKWHK